MRKKFAILTEGFTTTLAGGVIGLSPKYSVPKSWLGNAVLIANNAGTPGKVDVTFAGTYAVGDFIRITLVSQARSQQTLVKTFTHTVPAGGTAVASIAAAFAAQISGAINAGLTEFASATSALGVLTVTQSGAASRSIQSTVFTNSTLGTAVGVVTATVLKQGRPSNLIENGIDPAAINLATYDTVKIKLSADAPVPFIDSDGKTVSEIIWYGTVGEGAGLVTDVNS